MKVFVALFALVLAVAAEPSYLPASVVSHQVPVSTSVWPPYGVYGKGAAVLPSVVLDKYSGYPAVAGAYGNWGWPSVYGNQWGYSAPVLTTGTAKIVNNGLWNNYAYGGYGYGNGLAYKNNYLW
ncbi:uncharacterized protein LOC129741206 [Uranotaenia lowii]|uniref:uncharacterized protein LOC129741206 n=1 Tax=Uranotaenia lowii TaxID=190385 RepID=UPI0024798139|nr:uncharacterized protein LOC129741206 [Uranotaenia lowii]